MDQYTAIMFNNTLLRIAESLERQEEQNRMFLEIQKNNAANIKLTTDFSAEYYMAWVDASAKEMEKKEKYIGA